jgi:hypothetical protein
MNGFGLHALLLILVTAGVLPIGAQEPGEAAAKNAPATEAPAKVAPAPAPKAIFDAIPGDSAAFAVIRNGRELNDKIMRVLRQLGLDQMLPIPQPLDMLRDYTGLGAGFIDAGSIGVAVMPFEGVEALPQQMGIFFATSNLETMISGMSPQPLEGEKGLWSIKLLGEPSFVGGKQGFAVMGASKEIVKRVLASETSILSRIPLDRMKAYADSDAMVWAGGDSGGKLIESMTAWVGEMQADGGAAGPDLAGLAELTKYSKGVDGFSAYLRLDDRGLGATLHADIKAGTELSRLAASQKGTDQSLLAGLPDERFVVAGGQVRNELGNAMGMQGLDTLFEMEPVKQMTDPEKLGVFREKLSGWLGQSRQVGFSLSLLPEGSDGMVGAVVIAEGGDSAQWNASFIELIEAGKSMVTTPELRQLLSLVQVKRDAEKIGEVSVHHLSIDLAKVEELPEEQVLLIKKLFGGEGLLIRLAAVGGQRNVLVLGGGKARMEKTLALVEKNAAPLSGNVGVQLVNKGMPKSRTNELYVSIDALSRLAKTFLDLYGMGEMLPGEIPQINAPIALIGSGEGNHMQVDFLLPMEAVVGIKDIAVGAFGALMPGAGQKP